MYLYTVITTDSEITTKSKFHVNLLTNILKEKDLCDV